MSKCLLIRDKARERGAVFILAMAALMVLLILGASLIERAQTAVERAAVQNRSAKSFHLAEAGVNKALWSLNQASGWVTYGGETHTPLPGGFVDIAVTPPPSQRGIFTEHLTVVATGYLPGSSGARRTPRTIRVITHKDPRWFEYAIFGSEKVVVGNGTVTVSADSYSSDSGSYGGANITKKAHVGTNSKAANAVEILPLGTVYGDVRVGAGANPPTLAVNNKGTISGTISALEGPNVLPSITSVPAGAINLGDVYLDGTQQLTLNAGTYYMTDLDVLGSAQIICNGKVVIYLSEVSDQGSPDIRIGGRGIVNTSQIPANLVLYCMDDVVSVSISGSAAFYGGIYAPKANIVLNSGEVYGSLVGRDVRLNGATACLHYDETLRDHSNPNALTRSWEVL